MVGASVKNSKQSIIWNEKFYYELEMSDKLETVTSKHFFSYVFSFTYLGLQKITL